MVFITTIKSKLSRDGNDNQLNWKADVTRIEEQETNGPKDPRAFFDVFFIFAVGLYGLKIKMTSWHGASFKWLNFLILKWLHSVFFYVICVLKRI